jgi:hypothetical protein
MLHRGRCHKCCGGFAQIMENLMPKYAFSYPRPNNIRRGHNPGFQCRYRRPVMPSVCIIFSLICFCSVSRASSLFQGMGEFSTFLRRLSLSINYLPKHSRIYAVVAETQCIAAEGLADRKLSSHAGWEFVVRWEEDPVVDLRFW